MPLHRDIHWVGRQWAVTGFGMQAIDQRLNGVFDVEVSRLWEDDLAERMQDLKWFNIADFEKGLAAARKRYAEPPGKTTPQKPTPEKTAPEKTSAAEKTASSENSVSAATDDRAIQQPEPLAHTFDMRLDGLAAKLVAPWRIRGQR
jgi:hypothetical protein